MPLPELFGPWLLVRRIAARSMSEVFVAVRAGDPSARWYVLKRPPVGERASGRVAESIRAEASALRALAEAEPRPRGVVRFVESGSLAGLPFLVVEHVRGVALAELVGTMPLPVAPARLVARDLARLLAGLHQAGVVHGDLAPSNVVVDEDGELVLVDFGLAHRVGEARPAPAGTAGYVSPEAALGRAASPSDDVYGWGVVTAELALGRRLFDDGDLAQAAARTSLPAGMAIEGLDDVERALAADPAARPALAEVAERIEVDEGARGELAALVARAERSIETPPTDDAAAKPAMATPSGPTKAAPLRVAEVVVSDAGIAPPALGRPGAVVVATDAPVSPGPGRPYGRRGGLVALVAVVASLLAFFVGRRTARPRMGQLTLPMLPARTEVLLDGKVLVVPGPGRPIPIEPGKHTLTVEVGRRESREYEFVVSPGEHLLVVNVTARALPRARDAGEEGPR
jgi:serine/threonine-protein kinase